MWADSFRRAQIEQQCLKKAISGLEKEENGKESSVSEKNALRFLKWNRKAAFSNNQEELDNPTEEDLLAMDKITLEELTESAKDSRRIGERKYEELLEKYNKIVSPSESN